MSRKVLIIMGSDSDLKTMEETAKALKLVEVPCELRIASAHRTPQKAIQLAQEARDRGFGVIVAGAGMAAHLGGVLAAHTTLPVIGVPLASGILAGMDALMATVQMPQGIPVACMGVGASGAYNAGLLAAAILAVEDLELARRLEKLREEMAEKVEQKDAALQRKA